MVTFQSLRFLFKSIFERERRETIGVLEKRYKRKCLILMQWSFHSSLTLLDLKTLTPKVNLSVYLLALKHCNGSEEYVDPPDAGEREEQA